MKRGIQDLIDVLRKRNAMMLCLFLLPATAFPQARIVVNNNAYLVVSNSSYLVIDNGNSNALSTAGTGGNIVSESETNRIRWNISSNTGTYTIPFYDIDNAVKIPFSATISAAGSAGGRIDFSTYDNASWDNATYMPSDVTNMSSLIGGPNNSAKVVDRFWIIESNHTTKPAATFSFTYVDAEWSAAGNTITEANLGAQRFNTPDGDWDTYPPAGTINTTTNTVVNVPVTAANFFRSWTLTDNASPLPIELIAFTSACDGNATILNWITATETNNDFFTIEKSADGSYFTEAGTVNGAGNSSTSITYTFTDPVQNEGSVYYRLKQTDHDGHFEYFPVIIAKSCNSVDAELNTYNNQQGNLVISISAAGTENYTAELFDASGKKIRDKKLKSEKGYNSYQMDISGLRAGIYLVSLQSGSQRYARKFHIN